jgi:hypothetical protein
VATARCTNAAITVPAIAHPGHVTAPANISVEFRHFLPVVAMAIITKAVMETVATLSFPRILVVGTVRTVPTREIFVADTDDVTHTPTSVNVAKGGMASNVRKLRALWTTLSSQSRTLSLKRDGRRSNARTWASAIENPACVTVDQASLGLLVVSLIAIAIPVQATSALDRGGARTCMTRTLFLA